MHPWSSAQDGGDVKSTVICGAIKIKKKKLIFVPRDRSTTYKVYRSGWSHRRLIDDQIW